VEIETSQRTKDLIGRSAEDVKFDHISGGVMDDRFERSHVEYRRIAYQDLAESSRQIHGADDPNVNHHIPF
jgi:hypothetical protein